ncbi:hypothetical protein ETU08_08545 [Apibacter muscae]|uniref:type IX secretion system motor protein PorM/GldM n=1 Tax=Apibacter muscae TaxID=2509004 RepID=UPI0011AD00E6|nr:GldM family protein [Apibacter muscae]TWP28877.1 hypothetical protein ETU08_08545 [Apibacter muscae]
MAAGKQSARQKMINLMYLVFIAMLAMNVDREVLRSFEGVNESLQLSTTLTEKNNITFYESIESKKNDGDQGYVVISQKATEIKNQAQQAFAAIEKVKSLLKEQADYTTPQPGEETNYNSLQNTDVVNKVFFLEDTKPTPEVQDMIAKVTNFTQYILKGANKSTQDRINQLFDFSDKNNKSWLTNQFYDQPMIAALTNLTKLESNIRTEEGNIVRDLLANKLETEIEIKAFMPIVSSPKFVRAGEKFDVTIGFGAYDNTLKGTINLGGRNIPLSSGKAVVSMVGEGTGLKHVSGSITYETPQGPKTEKFDETYEVVADVVSKVDGNATLMADNMNVVYRGVVNPLSAAISGISGAVSLSASSGSVSSRGANKWNYSPGAGGQVVFTVSGKTSSGKPISQKFTYRIKNVPKAQGTIRGSNVVSMPSSSVSNQTISAAIPDFEFPVSFTVTGFKVKKPGTSARAFSGNSLRAAAGYLEGLKSGDQVLVFDISAQASGVSQQNISPVLINVQ